MMTTNKLNHYHRMLKKLQQTNPKIHKQIKSLNQEHLKLNIDFLNFKKIKLKVTKISIKFNIVLFF
jgi:hypothetical protein